MKYILAFNALYLTLGAVYFLRDLNYEFVIYVAVIIGLLAAVLMVHRYADFPHWMIWLFSIWGLMHVLGGAVVIGDHVLFAHRVFPLLDLGGEFYILKYDQVVHFYLYGLFAVMAHRVLTTQLGVAGHRLALFALAVLVSLGISGLNEIMEFLISLGMENGVGGYDNTMLDMCFNFTGALIAAAAYVYWEDKKDGPTITLP